MCEFCTFGPGRMFNIYYQGGLGDFDKLDISMGKPYLTKFRKSHQMLRKAVYECPRCGRNLKEADDGNAYDT